MARLVGLIAGCILFIGLTGCAANPDSFEVKFAGTLDKDILEYRDAQKARIDTLNEEYEKTSGDLMNTLATIGLRHLALNRDLAAQEVADQIAIDPNKTVMPTKLHDITLQTVQDQYKQMLAVDADIRDSRKRYSESYVEMTLTLSKLDSLHARLQIIVMGDTEKDAKAVFDAAQSAIDGYKKGVSESKK